MLIDKINSHDPAGSRRILMIQLGMAGGGVVATCLVKIITWEQCLSDSIEDERARGVFILVVFLIAGQWPCNVKSLSAIQEGMPVRT